MGVKILSLKPTNIARRHHHIPVISPLCIYIYMWLVVLTILKHMKVNGQDYPIYEKENKIHV